MVGKSLSLMVTVKSQHVTSFDGEIPRKSPFLMVKATSLLSELAVSSVPGTGRDLLGRWAGRMCGVYCVHITHTHTYVCIYRHM